MNYTVFNTEANNSLKADVYVYGIVIELAFILFTVPAIGFLFGLMLSFSKYLQYSCMGVSLIIFLMLWNGIHKGKKNKTIDSIILKMIYQNSTKYIHSDCYSLLNNSHDED